MRGALESVIGKLRARIAAIIPVLDEEGAIGPDHIRAELGEVLIKAHPGRTSRDEITLFKSLGLAIEYLAAAAHVYRKAEAETAGPWVEF